MGAPEQDAGRASDAASSLKERDLTEGVRKIEHVTRLWSPASLALAWTGMMLVAIAVSLDGQTVSSYQPYALSEFKEHSMLSAVSTLQNILNAAAKPVLAKVADAWGRMEALNLSVGSIVIGFIISGTSKDLGTLAAGQVFYTIGQVGIQFIQQILTADTTTLQNRSIFGSLLLAPAIFTAWIGAPIVSKLVPQQWRWAIVFPIVSAPVAVSLWWHQRRARRMELEQRLGLKKRLRAFWADADLLGLLLFTAGLVLVLLPMTLTARFLKSWSSPATVAMIVIGGLCFIAFIAYELTVPRYPILSIHLAKSRTVAAACMVEALLFLSYYLWQPYFYSFVVVANNMTPKAATNMVIAQGVSTAVVGLLTAFLVKATGRCKYVVVAGCAVKIVGAGLMIRYSNPSATTVQVLFGQLVSGAGTGMISIVAQTAAQAVAGHQGVASVTTLYEASRAIGGAIGNAISGAIWTNLLLERLREHLPAGAQGVAVKIQNSFVVATSYKVGSLERVAIDRSYTEVMRLLLIPSIAVLAVSFVVAFAMEDVDLFELDLRDKCNGAVIGTGRFTSCIPWLRNRDTAAGGGGGDETRR